MRFVTPVATHKAMRHVPIGDILAVFDRPSRAVDAALALRGVLGEIQLVIRAGVHVGEVEVRRDDVSGIAAEVPRIHVTASAPGLRRAASSDAAAGSTPVTR